MVQIALQSYWDDECGDTQNERQVSHDYPLPVIEKSAKPVVITGDREVSEDGSGDAVEISL